MSEPLKVPVDVKGMRDLYEIAIKNETLPHWALVALDWMEAASDEVSRLNDKLLDVSCETSKERGEQNAEDNH